MRALLLLSLLVAFLRGFSQQCETTVNGKVTNYPMNYIVIGYHEYKDTVRLTPEGTFSLKLKNNKSDFYSVKFGKMSFPCYFISCDAITITYNGKPGSEGFQITGASAPYSEYMNKRLQQNRTTWGTSGLQAQAMNENSFIHHRDSIALLRSALLKKYSTEHSFDKYFVEVFEKADRYLYGSEMINYENGLLRQGNYQITALRAAWQRMPWDDAQMLYIDEYKGFLESAISATAAIAYNASSEKTYYLYCAQQVEAVCNNIKSAEVRNYIFPGIMDGIVDQIGLQDLRPLIKRFSECCTDQALVNRITRKAAQYAYLYPGEMAPDFAAFDTTGKKYSPATFKGKVLYIDVWATWCGPCKREIPSLHKLEEDFKGKNVQFISISTDRDEAAWRGFIKRESMAGLQLHQSDKAGENMSQNYLVNSIPRFIIIDEQGKIVSADGPRPSSGEEVRTLLDRILND